MSSGVGYQACLPVTSQNCYYANNCSPFGYCGITPESGHHSCHCLKGYEGDGYTCVASNRTTEANVWETTVEETTIKLTTSYATLPTSEPAVENETSNESTEKDARKGDGKISLVAVR